MLGIIDPWGRHDPGNVSVVPGERFRGPLSVAATGVELGVDVVLSNQRARTHCRLRLDVALLLNFVCVD